LNQNTDKGFNMKQAKWAVCFLAGCALLGSAAVRPARAQQAEGGAAAAGSTPGATGRTQWLIYKADPQRTGDSGVAVGATPNLMWRHPSELSPSTNDSSPLVIGPPGQRRIYFALDKYVISVDAQTGQEIKRSQALSAPVASPLTLLSTDAGDLILAVANSGEMSALRTSDLGLLWSALPDKNKTVSVINSAPIRLKTAGGERIIVAIGTGKLVAFDLMGQLDPDWETVLGSFASAPTATAAVSSDGSTLYVPTQDKRVWVVSTDTGKVQYSISTRSAVFTSPVVTDEHLIVVNGSTLNGLQLRNGREDWVFDVKSDLSAASAMKGADGSTTIFVGARNGRFYALNDANGRVLWSTDLADSVSSPPTVAKDMVFVGTRNGIVFGLSPTDGKILWRYRLRSERVITQPRFGRNRGRFGNRGGFGGAAGGAPDTGGFGGGDANANSATLRSQREGEQDQPIWNDTPTQTFGVSSTPIVLNDQIYVLADSSALYAFTAQPFDAEPPQLTNPQLSILNTEGKPALQRLDNEKGWLGPGRGPVEFIAEISDIGSGVDPASIRVTFNRQELPAAALTSYSDITGKLLVKLTDAKVPALANLEDGNQTVLITARDYRGNEMNQTITFMVDNTAPMPGPNTSRSNNNNNDNNDDNDNNDNNDVGGDNNNNNDNNDAGGDF
jgi:outer membrane protein assembly factor BamB